jgi:hypothetical protein
MDHPFNLSGSRPVDRSQPVTDYGSSVFFSGRLIYHFLATRKNPGKRLGRPHHRYRAPYLDERVSEVLLKLQTCRPGPTTFGYRWLHIETGFPRTTLMHRHQEILHNPE